MSQIQSLNLSQLRKILAIKEEIENLKSQLNAIVGQGHSAGGEAPPPMESKPGKRRRKVSAEGRAHIAAAARARWARVKGEAGLNPQPIVKAKRRLSAAGRAAIIAATKARWARTKAAQ